MTPEQASGLLQHLLPGLQMESATTARVLAAVPDDTADYKPSDKCMTGQKLAGHIASSSMWFLQSIIDGKFEAGDDSAVTSLKPSEVAALYSSKMPALMEQVGKLSPEYLAKELDFYTFRLPAVEYLDFCMRHMIHHRGQLSSYLRPMGGKVPSIYGGSADEPMGAAATN